MANQAFKNGGIDRSTSSSICSAIGERLKQTFQPETSALPSRLEDLLAEMRRQESERETKD